MENIQPTTHKMHTYVLSVISSDRPGIVAAVSEAVEHFGGNILSCSQTVLCGYFTLITILELPQNPQPQEFADNVRKFGKMGDDYQIVVRKADEIKPKMEKQTDPFVIAAFGEDRPGIICRFTKYFFGRDINIVDLFAEQSGKDFHIVAQLDIPKELDIRLIQDDLEEIATELGFTVRLQHKNIFTVTNHLRFA